MKSLMMQLHSHGGTLKLECKLLQCFRRWLWYYYMECPTILADTMIQGSYLRLDSRPSHR